MDPNQWQCEECTFINTVRDWTNKGESMCDICQNVNKEIGRIIEENKQADQYITQGEAGDCSTDLKTEQDIRFEKWANRGQNN